MLGLSPIQTETRDRAVITALARYVASAQITPGMRLPPERALADALRVSRATIREALKRWEGLGIIEMRKGSGSYLKTPVSPDSIHLPITVSQGDVFGLFHAIEVRRSLESEAAAICAERATDAEIATIATKLSIMEVAFVERQGDCADEDWEFHLTIIRTTGNPLFEQIVTAMHGLFHRFWERPLDIPAFGQASFPYHRTLYEAIARRDPNAARAEALKLIACTEADLRRGTAVQKSTQRETIQSG